MLDSLPRTPSLINQALLDHYCFKEFPVLLTRLLFHPNVFVFLIFFSKAPYLMFCNFSCVASGLLPFKRKCFPSRVARVYMHMNIFHWWIWYTAAAPLIVSCSGPEWCHNGGTPTMGKTSQSTAERSKHKSPLTSSVFNIPGLFTEEGVGSWVHQGAQICLRSSHLSSSSVNFSIFDHLLFLTALFSIMARSL